MFPLFRLSIINDEMLIYCCVVVLCAGGRASRVAFTAFGAGCGVGATYKQASFEFDKEKAAAK